MKVITRSDGFQYAVINNACSKAIFLNGEESVYKLYNDGSEALVESLDELLDAHRKGIKLGIEIDSGSKEEMFKDYINSLHRWIREFEPNCIVTADKNNVLLSFKR